MMLTECESLLEGVKLYQHSEVGHMCGLHAKAMSRYSLGSIFNRIRQTPKVAAIVPGLAEYSDWVNPYRFDLQTKGSNLKLPSRNRRVLHDLKQKIGKSEDHFYPFVSRNSTSDHDLLLKVHNAVPRSVEHSIRADVCQDLVCAVLAGDIKIESLHEAVPWFLKTWNKLRPHETTDYYKWSSWRMGLDADAWKRQFVARDFEEREFTERVSDLQEQWGCGDWGHDEPHERPEGYEVQPTHRMTSRDETLADIHRRQRRQSKPAGDEVMVEINVYKKGQNMRLPPDWLDQLKKEYPQRYGDQGWIAVRTLVPRALSAGATWDEILNGTRAYRTYCEANAKVGTEYVKRAQNFYGPNQGWTEDYAPPPKPKTQKEIRDERRWEALRARAGASAFRPPTLVESADVYETALRQAEREHGASPSGRANRGPDLENVVSMLGKAKRA
jgi:hypothetical protein